MTTFWASLENILNNFMPQGWSLWQSLMCVGTLFGVIVWCIKK